MFLFSQKLKIQKYKISTFYIRFCQPLPRSKQYMFPELRSRMNALEHCGSLGNSRVVLFWEKKKPFISGGHVVVPKTEKQNLDVVAIAEQYYKVDKKVPYLLSNTTRWTGKIEIPIIATNVFQICEAKQNSGKTIGLESILR